MTVATYLHDSFPFAHLLQMLLHPAVWSSLHLQLKWLKLRVVPVKSWRGRERRRRKWSSFTHLKITHLTGSSSCVSPPCGSTLTHTHTNSHTHPLRYGCVIEPPCSGLTHTEKLCSVTLLHVMNSWSLIHIILE